MTKKTAPYIITLAVLFGYPSRMAADPKSVSLCDRLRRGKEALRVTVPECVGQFRVEVWLNTASGGSEIWEKRISDRSFGPRPTLPDKRKSKPAAFALAQKKYVDWKKTRDEYLKRMFFTIPSSDYQRGRNVIRYRVILEGMTDEDWRISLVTRRHIAKKSFVHRDFMWSRTDNSSLRERRITLDCGVD